VPPVFAGFAFVAGASLSQLPLHQTRVKRLCTQSAYLDSTVCHADRYDRCLTLNRERPVLAGRARIRQRVRQHVTNLLYEWRGEKPFSPFSLNP